MSLASPDNFGITKILLRLQRGFAACKGSPGIHRHTGTPYAPDEADSTDSVQKMETFINPGFNHAKPV